MLNEPFLCEYCVADNELRLELQERGSESPRVPWRPVGLSQVAIAA